MNILTRFGVLAHHAIIRAALTFPARLGKAAGEFAFGVVHTGHKRAELAAAQGQAAIGAAFARAERAGTRIGPVFTRGEQEIGEVFVQCLGHFRGQLVHHLVGLGLEVLPEPREHRLVILAPVGNDVEFILHARREIIGDIGGKKPFEKGGQQPARFLCEEAAFLHPHIGPVAQGLDGRGIGGWPPDAEFLQPFDKRRFGETRRRLGEMLGRIDRALGRAIARFHHGQQAAFIVFRIVEAFLIDREETGEADHLSGSAQLVLARRIAQSDGGAFQLRGRHLARHRAFEDQVIQLALVTARRAFAGEIGRANRLVRFLRVLGLGAVETRLFRAIILAETRGDGIARGHNRAHIHLHAVGPHIGDRARFIKRLRQPHGVLRRETQLACSLLLQGRGGERRRGVAFQRLGFDAFDGEAPRLHGGLGFHGNALRTKAELFQLIAPELYQPRIELSAIVHHPRDDAPVFVRTKRLDLAFALNDQTQRDRLHAARAFRAGQLAPQHRREGKAEQVIERAAGEIGVDQRLIELARFRHRFGHSGFGDRVEGDAVNQRWHAFALFQQFQHVPADRFAFAVRVSRQHKAARALGRICNLFEAALLVAVKFPLHREIGVRIYAAILGRQIADVAVGGENLEVLAQIFLDSLRLGGRFNDDKLHDSAEVSLTCVRARVERGLIRRQAGCARGS